MQIMIDDFIWTSPFKLQSHDTQTYVLFDEFIWLSADTLKERMLKLNTKYIVKQLNKAFQSLWLLV